ncbi:MAG: SUMF1/EgtB/PvdO family nonheme iron enzyme [Candidatus Scalindua sediminis]|nr:SUMF1/EgtB/PvdO family nonheme iron enzyme [Candidatus Scalindua sediminis]
MEYRLRINSDIYCEEDLLGFDRYINNLSEMINNEDFKTPFCIGIFGNRGSGRTSFMQLLETRLSEDKTNPRSVPVWFNPWRYEREEHLVIPFLKTLGHEIRRYKEETNGIGRKLSKKLKELSTRIGEISEAFAYATKEDFNLGGAGIELDASKMAGRKERIRRHIKKAKSVSEEISSIYYEIVHELASAIDKESVRIVVFIDDLDRCLPDRAVEFLKVMKLFLDVEGYLLILGIGRIGGGQGSLPARTSRSDGVISPEAYLDNMIQLPLELPAIEAGRKRRFIESLMCDTDGFKEHSDIIEVAVGDNPSTLKRFINFLSFTVRLAETLKDDILNDKIELKESEAHKKLLQEYFNPLMYIKWTIIAFRYPEIHNDIKGNGKRLLELQKVAREEEEEKVEKRDIQVIDERLKGVLAKGEGFPDDDWLIERFIHLTESTVVVKERESEKETETDDEKVSEKVSETIIEKEEDRAEPQVYSQIHKPGDMVIIPKGKFLYGEANEEKDIDYDYYIDVFPVTNKQYKEFVDEKKRLVPYREEGWAVPYNWDRRSRTYREGTSDHPVVLVSYKNAVDFCKWRTKKEGEDLRLPTEEEWEKAARGVDGRMYPWGNDFDFKKINCADNHVGKVLKDYDEWVKEFESGFYEDNKKEVLTTECGRFTGGVSPYGCFDMAGNVWEWTDSSYEDKKNEKVMRGGAWVNLYDDCRCTDRNGFISNDMISILGFRCVRNKKP